MARADDARRGRHHRFAALQFVASVPEPISFLPALRMQMASSFVSRIAPANTGTLAIGVRFLQRSGLDPGPAAAAVGLRPVGLRGPPGADGGFLRGSGRATWGSRSPMPT